MSAVDITPQTNLIETPQGEAAENIQHAQVFDMPPDAYKDHKPDLAPVVRQAEQPATASPTVARYIASSEQHASAVAPDAHWYSGIEQMFQDAATRFQNKTGPDARIKELAWKKATSDVNDPGSTFTDDDAFELKVLQNEQANNYGSPPSKLGAFTGTATDLAADMTSLVSKNAKTIVAATAISTGLGAATGAVAGLPGAVVGAARGAATGVMAGVATAGLDQGYKDTVGSTYLALDNQKDADGNPVVIDEGTKRALAHGVGILTGAIQLGTDKLLLDKMPYLQRLLNPASAAAYVMAPANVAIKNALIRIGSAAVTQGTSSTAQALAGQLAQNVGATYKDGEVNFSNGLLQFGKNLATNEGGARDEALKAGEEGFFAGSILSGTHEVVGHALTEGARNVRDDLRARRAPGAPERDVTPSEPGRISAGPTSDIVDVDESGNPQPPNPGQRAAEVLHMQDTLNATSEIAKGTKLQKISPVLSNELREQIAKSNGIDHLWVDRESLENFVGDDAEKRAAVWTALHNANGEDAASLNAPTKLPISSVLDIHDKWPEFSEHVKLDPSGPDPQSAKAYVERVQQAEKDRAQLFKKMGALEVSPEERAQSVKIQPDISDADLADKLGTKEVAQAYLDRLDLNAKEGTADPEHIAAVRNRVQAMVEHLPDDASTKSVLERAMPPAEPSHDVHGEADYLDEATHTGKLLEGLMPQAEIDRTVRQMSEAKRKVAESIHDANNKKYNSIIDLEAEMQTENERQQAYADSLNDLRTNLVEKFLRGHATEGEGSITANHAKPGYSIYAMDPKFLTDAQRSKWLDDGALKAHKAFVKGGTTPYAAARLLGVKDGDTLLKILSETPSRDRLVQNHLEEHAQDIRDAAESKVDADRRAALDDRFAQKTKNDLAMMKHMIDASPKSQMKDVARYAGKLPRPEELRAQAEQAVASMKIDDLNVNQFKVGARKSQRMALEAKMRGDFVNAAEYLRKAALNNELTLATMKAIADSNKLKQYAKVSESKEYQQIRKDAGRSFQKAHDELSNLINLVPGKRNPGLNGDYQKWVQQMYATGQGDFSIRDEYSDVRQNIGDVTIGQAREIDKRLRSIDYSAKIQNELLTADKAAKDLQTVEAVASKLVTQAKSNERYSEKRALTPMEEMSQNEKLGSWLANAFDSLRPAGHVLRALDGGKDGGIFYQEIMAPLKGEGVYSEYGQSNLNKREFEDGEYYKAAIEKFGKEQFKGMRNRDIDVPEFVGNELIGRKQSEGTIFMMLLNSGTVSNQEALAAGMGVDRGLIDQLIERELTPKHMELAQAIWSRFKEKFPDVAANKKHMEGVEPDFIPARYLTMWGTNHEGGYYPLRYDSSLTLKELQRKSKGAIDRASGQTKPQITDSYNVDELTKHGFDMARQGSGGRPVILDMQTIGQANSRINHALAYQSVLRDVMLKLEHPEVAKAIAGSEGIKAYNQLLYTVENLGNPAVDQNGILASVNDLNKSLAQVQAATITGLLAYKWEIALKHLSNGVYSMKSMGFVNGTAALAHVSGKMLANPHLMKDFYALAAEINPELRDHLNGIERSARDLVSQEMPTREKGLIKSTAKKITDPLLAGGAWIISSADAFVKTAFTLAAATNYKAGLVEGKGLDVLDKMTPAQIDNEMKAYSNAVVGNNLPRKFAMDKTPLEHDPKWQKWEQFYGPVRNLVANILGDLRDAKDASGRTYENIFKDKDLAGAKRNATKVAKGVILTMIAGTIARLFHDLLAGNETPFTQDESSASDILAYVALSPPFMLATLAPGVNAAMYTWEKYGRDREHGKRGDMTITSFETKAPTDMLYAMRGFIDEWNGVDYGDYRVKNAKVQAPLEFMGIPAPSGQALRGFNWLQDNEQFSAIKESMADRMSKQFDSFIKKQDDVPAGDKIDEDVMNELKKYNDSLKSDGASNDTVVPPNVIDKIKQIESGGNPFAKNPNSSAAGLYQFTVDTWNKIKREAPDLGLTDAGRTLANGEQQERAMQWFTQTNVNKLAAAGVAVNESNVYAAHFLGADKAIEVLKANGNEKLKAIVGQDVISANGFSNSMKVGAFKTWLKKRIASAQQETASLDK